MDDEEDNLNHIDVLQQKIYRYPDFIESAQSMRAIQSQLEESSVYRSSQNTR